MGELILHPTHWLFKQCRRPVCPACRREIVAGDAVVMEDAGEDKVLFKHAGCVAGKGDSNA